MYLGNYGRMGNQLFQYAVTKAVSLERGYKLKIPNPEKIVHLNQKCQLDQFNIKCDFLEDSDISKIKYRFKEPDHADFYPQVFDVRDDTDLFGYFQNYRYFSKYEKEIRHDLKLNTELEEKAKDYVASFKKNGEQIVSIHFRRGDNTDGTYHYPLLHGEDGLFSTKSVHGQYITKALEYFSDKKTKYMVFSGGSQKGMVHNQSDIDWCKQNLKGERFVFCEGKSDMEDFAIMKNCDHNIISHMTSFGWWAALLNENLDKVTIAPQNYTVPDDGRVQRGFYPNTWRII
tara:strand:+ start:65 stop:925 length:861 start_codon:yes stop_codon:yes gene_type:complete